MFTLIAGGSLAFAGLWYASGSILRYLDGQRAVLPSHGLPDYSSAALGWISLDEGSEVVQIRYSSPPEWEEGWGIAAISTIERAASRLALDGWEVKRV